MRRDLTAFAGSARSLWLVVACVATGCTGVVGGLEGAEGERSPRPGNAAVGRGGTASGSGATGGGLSGGGLSGGASTGTGAGGVAGGSQGSAGSGQQTTSKVVRQPLRPLTPFELDNALRDLLGDESGSALALRSDVAKKLTETAPNANLIGLASFRALEDLSLTAARAFAASPDQRLGCAQGTAIEPCTQSFVRAFARRAFRRPPTDVEVARYAGIRAALEPAQGRPEALARTLQAIVLSPSFLYLTTLGANDAAALDGSTDVPLSKDELAAHLAFFLWASLPDAALLAAADAGSLATEAGLASEVDRMLGDPRAQNAVGRFVLGWLGVLDLTRAKKTYAGFDGALARSMQKETTTLVRDWFVKGDRGVSALLEADYSFVDENLATFYGLTGTAKVLGDAAVRVQIADQTNRWGVLSHASWLAAHGNESGSGPLHRGQWIWEHALCGEPREAPANAANKAPAFTPDLTTRQWNEAIASSCAGASAISRWPRSATSSRASTASAARARWTMARPCRRAPRPRRAFRRSTTR